MQTKFEDVIFVHYGSVGNFDFISDFKQALQSVIRTEMIQFKSESNKKLVFEYGDRAIKNTTTEDGWGDDDSIYLK
jgi:hypothetical protein